MASDSTDSEHLVVSTGTDNIGGLAIAEEEIFGQRTARPHAYLSLVLRGS